MLPKFITEKLQSFVLIKTVSLKAQFVYGTLEAAAFRFF